MTTDTIPTWARYPGPPPTVYEQHFVPAIGRPFAERVIEAAGPRRGERVLDVACGTGIVARLAAERVGADLVAGIDGHPEMLSSARSVNPDIDWRQASAEGLPFDDASFDVVVCSLGLQFFVDQVRALGEMRRVMRPGARLAVATVGPTPEPFRMLHRVLSAHLGEHVAAFVDAVFALDEPDRLGELMNSAGLHDVEATTQKITLHLGPPADFFWQYLLATPLAEHVAPLDDDDRAALERAIVERWRPLADDGGLQVEVDMVLGTATSGT
jgi:ubiquinone/menaquinone biosynthesis C-methylase UbiE